MTHTTCANKCCWPCSTSPCQVQCIRSGTRLPLRFTSVHLAETLPQGLHDTSPSVVTTSVNNVNVDNHQHWGRQWPEPVMTTTPTSTTTIMVPTTTNTVTNLMISTPNMHTHNMVTNTLHTYAWVQIFFFFPFRSFALLHISLSVHSHRHVCTVPSTMKTMTTCIHTTQSPTPYAHVSMGTFFFLFFLSLYYLFTFQLTHTATYVQWHVYIWWQSPRPYATTGTNLTTNTLTYTHVRWVFFLFLSTVLTIYLPDYMHYHICMMTCAHSTITNTPCMYVFFIYKFLCSIDYFPSAALATYTWYPAPQW